MEQLAIQRCRRYAIEALKRARAGVSAATVSKPPSTGAVEVESVPTPLPVADDVAPDPRPADEAAAFDSRQFKWGDTWPLISTGRGTYGDINVPAHTGDPHSWIRIGNYCSIALNVEFLPGGNHRLEWASTYPFRIVEGLPGAYADGMPWSKGDIVVGSDVWIGRDAFILGGITIGHGAVVAAHAVVTRDVRPYAIVAGNPAREVRRRFSDETVEALLEAAWWEWPHEEIVGIVDLLNGRDGPEGLIAYARERARRDA
jgi:acetyltransferase-like isoleucine patch superfamily enzyme